MEYENGDPCPESIDGESCQHNLTVREHKRDPQFNTAPAAPVIEVVCPIHGVVEEV